MCVVNICEIGNQPLHKWIQKTLLVSTCLRNQHHQLALIWSFSEKLYMLRLDKLTSMNFCTEDLVVRAFSITFPDVL